MGALLSFFFSLLFFSFLLSLACPVRAWRSQVSQCMALATSSYHCNLQDLQEGFRGDGRGERKITPEPSKQKSTKESRFHDRTVALGDNLVCKQVPYQTPLYTVRYFQMDHVLPTDHIHYLLR